MKKFRKCYNHILLSTSDIVKKTVRAGFHNMNIYNNRPANRPPVFSPSQLITKSMEKLIGVCNQKRLSWKTDFCVYIGKEILQSIIKNPASLFMNIFFRLRVHIHVIYRSILSYVLT